MHHSWFLSNKSQLQTWAREKGKLTVTNQHSKKRLQTFERKQEKYTYSELTSVELFANSFAILQQFNKNK